MFRNGLAHSGVYSAAGVPKLKGVKWTFHTHGEVVSSPAVVEGVVYVGSNDGNLYAIDQQTGAQKWTFSTEARISSSPAVDHGLVYFNSYDGNFYAVDTATGKLRWKFAQCGGAPLCGNASARLSSGGRNHARSLRRLSVVARGVEWRRLLRQRRREHLRARRRHGRAEVEVPDRRCSARVAGHRRWKTLRRELGQLLLCARCGQRKRALAFQNRRRPGHPQPGRHPVFGHRGERGGLLRLPRFEFLCSGCCDRAKALGL